MTNNRGIPTLVGAVAVASAMAAPWGCNLVVGAGDYVITDAGGQAGCNTSRTDRSKLDPILKACSRYVGCYPGIVPPYTLSDCVTFDYPHAFPQYACALGATDCEQIYTCRNLHVTTSTTDCIGEGNTCVGTQKTQCFGPGFGLYNECAIAAGGECATYVDAANKSIVDCRFPSIACTGTSSKVRCNGNTSYHCEKDVAYGFTCSSGFKCMTVGADTGCFSALTQCSAGPASCSGDIGHECVGGLQLDKTCAGGAGARCSVAGTDIINCLIDGCTNYDFDKCLESCGSDGVTATVCVGGAPLQLSCKDLGFTSCSSYLGTPEKHPKGYVMCE